MFCESLTFIHVVKSLAYYFIKFIIIFMNCKESIYNTILIERVYFNIILIAFNNIFDYF